MIYTITLGYAPSKMLKQALQKYYNTNTVKTRHIFVDQHYPIRKELNRAECYSICHEFGVEILNAGKNWGLHHGFNWALNEINPKSEDIVIAYDPDSNPIQSGWDQALVSVLADPTIAWSTLMGPRCEQDLSKYVCEEKSVNGIRVKIAPRAVVNTTCAWKISFLEKTNGLIENSEFYGHLEAPMFDQLSKLNLKQAFLPDFTESDHLRDLHDREFQVWKRQHAHEGTYAGDFGQWLEEGKPGFKEN